jgi:hypothetical protein
MRVVAWSRLGLAVALAAGGLSGCGGGSPAAVRVGDTTISVAQVHHWMDVLAEARAVPSPPHFSGCVAELRRSPSASQVSSAEILGRCRRSYTALLQRSLIYLISTNWLTGEAKARGHEVSAREVAGRLAEQESGSGLSGEAAESRQAGKTSADLKLEAEGQLAREKLRRLLAERTEISRSEIVSYYQQNKRSFALPERREVLLTNRKSMAAAEALKHEIESGRRDMASVSIEQSLTKQAPSMATEGLRIDAKKNEAREHAIFSARPGVVSGPVRKRVDYYVFVVKRIEPAKTQTLAEVEAGIRNKLAAEELRQQRQKFISEWKTRWTPKTSCAKGFVYLLCKQYRGPAVLPPEYLGL